MYQVAEIRGHALVQLNVSLQLRGIAKDWYEVELSSSDKTMFSEARGIQTWVNALTSSYGLLVSRRKASSLSLKHRG